MRSCPLLMSADQVEQREQVDPDDVDKVPVEAEVLNECDVTGGVSPGSCSEDHVSEDTDTDDHVQCVHSGHGEIEEEVKLGVTGHIQRQRLVVILRDVGIRSWIEEGLEAV